MYLSKVEIQRIRPSYIGAENRPKDEKWFIRETVRTFKVSGEDQAEIQRLANQLLEAYLNTHPGTIGTWTESTWYPHLEGR